MKFIHTIACILPVLTLGGCFTGIESTPKVTADNVKRESAMSRHGGENLLYAITPSPLSAWSEGKEFYVTSSRLNSIVSSRNTLKHTLNDGDTIRFVKADTITTVTGERLPRIEIADTYGNRFFYRPDAAVDTINIPFTIPKEIIDRAADILTGKRLYVLTSEWYATDGTPLVGRKFIPVTVTGVGRGNSFFPLRVSFKTADNEHFTLLMSVGASSTKTRRFDQLLSTTDPKLRYPEITDENWQLIQRGKVAEDMTLAECRLALGQPASVDRRPGYSTVREVWTYENGKYLIFEDGLLRSFRQ